MSILADKPSSLSTRNASHVPLPPIGATLHRPVRLHPRLPKGPITSNTPENVSALKAKYTDYTTWLKTSTRHNREPVLTEEILKHSLCQMGINVNQAEQLVTKCKWYVYQFQKDLQTDMEAKESHLPQGTEQQRHKTKPTSKAGDDDSSFTITPLNTKRSISSRRFPSPRRKNYGVLPAIQVSDPSSSSRHRHVDFDQEKVRNPLAHLPQHGGESTSSKRHPLSKLPSLASESSSTLSTENQLVDLDVSSSPRVARRNGLVAGQARSILRKQMSSTSSIASTEGLDRKARDRLIAPSSTLNKQMPLGTRSQRLFGGSECFAQIMNELEQQNKSQS